MRFKHGNFSARNIQQYCEDHSSTMDAILHELERETHLRTLAPQMMTDRLQGQLLSFLSQWIRPRQILEIGTFTGYASLCLAKGLVPNGELHTIEVNAELAYIIRKYIAKAKLEEHIYLHIGDAKEIVHTLDQTFDLIFIDAGKRDNAFYYEYAVHHLSQNGLLIVDNVLWSGKVLLEKLNKTTATIDTFNKLVAADDRVQKVMLPIRDGLTLIRLKN
ncbi:MAG: class I SAM-dependent methyltransferase [Bacteroidota bacterium]